MSSRLALGTVQFGMHYGVARQSERLSQVSAGEILRIASRAGVDTLDTAVAYGDSEKVLGSLGIQDWKVVSKLPAIPLGCKDVRRWVEDEVQNSLCRLRIKNLYAILLHRPAELLGKNGEELLRALCKVKNSGQAMHIGVSVYEPDELEKLFSVYDFDIVQAPLSILDRRLIDEGWADWLKAKSVQVHVRSIFLQGLLLMSGRARPSQFLPWSPVWRAWEDWLGTRGISATAACVRYVLSLSQVDKAVVGVDSVEQFEQILSALDGPLVDLPAWPQLDKRLLNPSRWSEL